MKIRQLKETLLNLNSFIVASHMDPEGDAIGSSLALFFALKDMGKKVCVYNESGVPHILKFLPGAEQVITEIDSVNEYDCLIAVDCGDLERIGKLRKRLEKLKIINIDHHATNVGYGHINYIDKDAAAAGEIVYELFKKMNFPVSMEIAVNLYTAIIVDTGSFRYASTTPRSLRYASELLAIGVNPWEVSKNIYETFPFERMKLLGAVLGTLELSPDGKVAFMVVTRKMFKDNHASGDLTEGFVNFGRAIEGVEVSVMFKEVEENVYKLSLRSKGLYDVSKVAQMMGGGGHRNAAGCRIKAPFSDAKQEVLNAIKEL